MSEHRSDGLTILTYTSLYPNAAQPQHAVFVENRLRHLLADGHVTAKVVAPVPWFPLRARAFGRYADLARVPDREERLGIEVLHPRYPVIPKVGMSIAPLLMYAWTKPAVARILRDGYDFDLIDAHYFYPDGVAAVLLGQHLGKPVTITARGTDINMIPRHAVPRRMIRWAARRAAGVITVSEALKDAMTRLDLEPPRVRVLRNGVDLDAFRPGNRTAARARLGVEPPVLLCVGNLVPLKGHDLVIRALPMLEGATLLIAGHGPEENRLRGLARALGLDERVRFLGSIAHAEMAGIYDAADVLVLASEREGWPNVLLEAMACGTPAVATTVGGVPEVVASPAAGRLLPRRDPECIAETVRELLDDTPDRGATRRFAEGFDWDQTTQGQIELFREILAEGPGQ